MAEMGGATADVLIMKQGPALSATSDSPATDPTPTPNSAAATETVETPAPTQEPPAVEGEPAEPAAVEGADAADQSDPADQDGDAKPAKPKRDFGQRLSELARARDAERARADKAIDAATKLSERLETALAALERTPKTEDKPAPEPAPRPLREQFDNPVDYDEALISWAASSSARAAAAEAARLAAEKAASDKVASDKAAADAEAAKQNETIVSQWNQAKATFQGDHPDFDEVVFRDDLNITMPMFHAITHAENGPAVAYHLATNPDDLARINTLPPMQQTLAIGALAGKLATPPAPAVSKTPRPIPRTVGSSSAATQKRPHEMTTEEYAAWRGPQLQAERRASTLGQRH